MENCNKNILLFGAGKSATVLINYLLKQSINKKWLLTLADADYNLAKHKLNNHPNGKAIALDINKDEERTKAIQQADIVISMLPPSLHFIVAKDCVLYKKNLLTASYLDDRIKSLEKEIVNNNLLFICEMGLDPGIDHMSAMQMIDTIHIKGGNITSFISHCGGLIAPESDDNPWHYKITWNPANVVNAGKDGAIFKENNKIVEADYHNIFKNCNTVVVPGIGTLAWYPNRDSTGYARLYGLQNASTFIRTTLRHPDFCTGWQSVIQAGLTKTNDQIEANNIARWFELKLKESGFDNFEDFLLKAVDIDDRNLIRTTFNYLGLNSMENIPSALTNSAKILQYLLETKLQLYEKDKDMIVMLHEMEYVLNNEKKSKKSYLIVRGDDASNTAMAKTVGVPLAIATEMILEKKLALKGLFIPTTAEIYNPVLKKLKETNIVFEEL